MLAKDFRPVSLTFFILKILERLVDRFLKTVPLLLKSLASFQYAYRRDRRTLPYILLSCERGGDATGSQGRAKCLYKH